MYSWWMLLLSASKMPEGQTEKARKRKKRTTLRKRQEITDDTLFCAGWVVVITSLGTEYCGEEILHLYRSRWQVELLFKRFKQNFSITTLKAGSKKYAETEVLLWLVIWAIPERQQFLAECFLAGKKKTVLFMKNAKFIFADKRNFMSAMRTVY